MKEEGQAAGKEINVELMRLDLASLESTKNFIENFKQKNLPLHMLVCNAGIALVPYGKSSLMQIKGCVKQVDILISKNQMLQILYLKHRVYKTS